MVARLTSVLVVLAATLRTGCAWQDVASTVDFPRFGSLNSLLDQSIGGVTNVRYEQFDPTAVVVVQAGQDGMPGVAGTDDNMNRVVDDRLELGATRSDDRCSVLTAEQLALISDDDVLVLQRGAFVPIAKDDVDSQHPARAIVLGESKDGRAWSLLVDL